MHTLIAFIFCVIQVCKVVSEGPIISLPNGLIRGKIVKSPINSNFHFYTYQGIPFAAPPVGNLRFQPPQPVQNWEGTKNVFSSSFSCYQVQKEMKYASEDCLYLSVSTPVSPVILNETKLEVLVFIYGGSFIHGNMNGYERAAFLMEENIIFVSFNYRVGPYGFLSTEDSVVPGNMGLKDQQFALKWIQRNIHLFGGDPEKVTLMGQIAGAASVTYQMLAPGSAGLFRAAIGCSASALCDWAHQKKAVHTAYGIAAEIDPNFTRNKSSRELLEFLQQVNASDINKTGDKYHEFAPVIEVPHPGAIISELMYYNAERGKFNKVPIFMGITSEESIGSFKDMESWIETMMKYDEQPKSLVDSDMYINNKTIQTEVGRKIQKLYVGNDTFENNPGKGVQFLSDNKFSRAIIKFAELISEYVDVYFYQFSYHGDLGGNKVPFDGIGKVAHSEDQRYFWSYFKDYSVFPESDVTTLRRYNKLISNFVKYLNPTPLKDDELFQEIEWPTVSKDHFNYLDIDNDLTIRQNPRNFSFKGWVNIFDRYARKPYISF